jgi:hypothetical protein
MCPVILFLVKHLLVYRFGVSAISEAWKKLSKGIKNVRFRLLIGFNGPRFPVVRRYSPPAGKSGDRCKRKRLKLPDPKKPLGRRNYQPDRKENSNDAKEAVYTATWAMSLV